MKLPEVITTLRNFKSRHPSADKAAVQKFFEENFKTTKERSVFRTDDYAIRFSEANTGSFSNVVLSLSALMKHDAVPFVVCVVRPNHLDFLLANATFLKRISHSSHAFRADNIKGSFLGHDIMDAYEETANSPEQFDSLFLAHKDCQWKDNVSRLVEATNQIAPLSTRFEVTPEADAQLLLAPLYSARIMQGAQVRAIVGELKTKIADRSSELLRAAGIDNVNLRGNQIEAIITGEITAHRLDDLEYQLEDGGRLVIDVKTKILSKASAPKAYNVDKMLRLLAKPQRAFCFLFVGLDLPAQKVETQLVSVFDPIILDATRVQVHWAGRASRGVTQLSGNLDALFAPGYQTTVDIERGRTLLQGFTER